MKSRFRIKDHGDDDGPSTRGLLFCANEGLTNAGDQLQSETVRLRPLSSM